MKKVSSLVKQVRIARASRKTWPQWRRLGEQVSKPPGSKQLTMQRTYGEVDTYFVEAMTEGDEEGF